MKTKQLILGAGLSLLGMFSYAQNGLEKIEVEKYYITNAADAAQADQESTDNGINTGALPVGSVTYRFYADLLPGYKILSVYADGTRNQSVKFTTTGSFYNNPVGLFTPVPGTTKAAIKNNLLALDTYLTLGAVAASNFGIQKTEDNGTANNVTAAANAAGVLLNADAALGIPLTTQDGMIAGTGLISPSSVGFSADATAAFNDGTVVANTMELTDGNFYTTVGAIGPVAGTNKVLIAQITTTNGQLHYELNILVQEGSNPGQNFVAKNPGAGDIVLPSLMGDLGQAANVPPTATITAPANNSNFGVGASVAIAADAADTDGTVASVEFFVDGTSVGVDNTAPFTATYTAAVGAHAITAKATDNLGLTGAASAAVNINVANAAPTATITAPANNASFNPGNTVAITADAADTDGSVASVEFFVDGTSVGVDNAAPYTASYTAVLGNHVLTAKATDNLGLVGAASTAVNISVVNGNVAPTATINTPLNNATFITGSNVAITATGNDPDGTVASIEFFVDGTSIGVDNASPFTATYNNATAGAHVLTAKATDNVGAVGGASTAVNIQVNNNAAPTATVTAPSNGASYLVGNTVAITGTGADTDGSVASIEFFVDGVSVGVDNASPFTASYVAAVGNHTITAKATDNLGLTGNASAPVNISVLSAGGAPYLVGTLSGVCSNPSFCLPIIAIDTVKNVIGYDLTLNYDKNKVHATGNVTVNPALINPSYASYVVNNNAAAGTMNISVYLNGTAPANAAFNGVGQLVCVEFTKDPSLLAVDTALFSVPSLQESYVTGVADKLAAAGKYINYKNTIYDGSLRFWTDHSPIKYDAANPSQYLITNIYGTDGSCGNKSATAVQPNLLGQFSYNILDGSSISIERDILPLTNVQPVINSADANLANKVLVNDLSFIPTIFQAIALDVNADGVISAGDVSQINQRSADVIHEFKQKWNYSNNGTSNGQLSKDWLFVDSTLLASPAYKISTTYPSNDGAGYSKSKVPVVRFCLAIPVTGPTTCAVYDNTVYTGILLGDVNGNYDAIANDGKLKKGAKTQTQDGTMYFNLDQATAGPGYIDVPVSFVSTDKIVGIDLALQFNENDLSYNDVIKHVGYFTDALGHYSPETKFLKFTANSIAQNLEADKNLISIRFNTLTGNVSNADLFNIAGYLNGNPVKAELKGNITTGISTHSNNVNVQVYPNPATNVINVLAPERAIVELTDLAGRGVMISTMVNANQKQEINVENLANGMYMLKVYNENFVSTQRVVVDNNK